MKKVTESGGEEQEQGEEGAGEEGAHEALAAMMASQVTAGTLSLPALPFAVRPGSAVYCLLACMPAAM